MTGLLLAKRRLEYYNIYDLDVNLICTNAEDLPITSNIVDYVYSYGVIHHSQNTQLIIDNIYKILKFNGRFTIMYYYKYSLTAFIEGCAKILNRFLCFITFDKNIFWKICLKLPYKPEIGHYRKFLDTGYSAILHAPFAQTFSKKESKMMFSSFQINSQKLYQLSPVVRPLIKKIFGQSFSEKLASLVGWDLVIKGLKKN